MADPRYKGLELKVGLFVLFAIISIAVLFIAIGVDKGLFTRKIQVYVYSDTGEGLSKGMSVDYAGFQISRVDDLRLLDDGRVRITINIPETYIRWIKRDSQFRLTTPTIIGNSMITVTTDLAIISPIVKDGDEYYLARGQGLSAIIESATPVVEDLKEIVSSVNIILKAFADKNGDFNKLMKGIGLVGDDLVNKKGTIGYLARSEELKVEIDKIVKDIRKVSSMVATLSEKIELNSDDIVNNTTDTLDNLKKITTNIEPATRDSELIRDEIQTMIENFNVLILKLQNTWPISSSDKPPDKVELK